MVRGFGKDSLNSTESSFTRAVKWVPENCSFTLHLPCLWWISAPLGGRGGEKGRWKWIFIIPSSLCLTVRVKTLANWLCALFCLLDVPYRPTMIQTDSGQCNSINITWRPPTREALGGLVTDYLAQIKRKGSKHPWFNCSSFDAFRPTSCLFTNLKKDTYYEVRVMARNKVGYGLPSHGVIKTENTGN